MSSIVVSGDTSGTVTLSAPAVAGSTTLTLPATSGTVSIGSGTVTAGGVVYTNGTSQQTTAAGTSGQYLQSAGAGTPVWATLSTPITTQLITDSTDITLNNFATPAYNNVGSTFSVNIPTSGLIKFSSFAGRLLNDATAAAHGVVFGIRIGSTNYWFNVVNNNGAVTTTNTLSGGSTASTFVEWNGTYSTGSGNGTAGFFTTSALDVTSNSIPTGTQTVQLIAAYNTTVSTIKGTTKQTRVVLEFVSA